MHTSLVRAQNVFGFFTTVAFAVAGLIAVTDFLAVRAPEASISVGNVSVIKGRPHYYSHKREEHAHIRFDLTADLSSLYTWNTKSLFIYVVACWPSPPSPSSSTSVSNTTMCKNAAVIWDTILTSPSSDHLSTLPPALLRKLLRSSTGRGVDRSRGRVSYRAEKPKYALTMPSGRVAGLKDVWLEVRYSVQPWVGLLTWGDVGVGGVGWWDRGIKGGRSEVFVLPAVKVKEAKKGYKDGQPSTVP